MDPSSHFGERVKLWAELGKLPRCIHGISSINEPSKQEDIAWNDANPMVDPHNGVETHETSCILCTINE